MNAKIPIKQLSEQVAAKVNIDAQDAQDAIKSIFALISNTLKDGKNVTLDALGTFSPDVNPQEPVKFTTAAELADELNAPFAMFEPEVIADELSNAELSAVGTAEAATSQKSQESATMAATTETPEATPVEQPAPRVGWAAARPSDPFGTPVETLVETPVEKVTEPVETPVEVATPTPTPVAKTVAITTPPPSVSEPPVAPAPVNTPTPSPRPILEVPEWPEEEDTDEPQTTPTIVHNEPTDNQGRFKTGFFWGLIVGLLIGALLLFGYAMYFAEAF